MKIEVKLGRWRTRGGGVAIVDERVVDDLVYPWWGIDSVNCVSCWRDNGLWLRTGQSKHDLVAYLGPLEEKK